MDTITVPPPPHTHTHLPNSFRVMIYFRPRDIRNSSTLLLREDEFPPARDAIYGL